VSGGVDTLVVIFLMLMDRPPPKGWRPNNINTTQMNETRPTDCMETCLAGRTVSTRTPVGRRWRLCGVSVSCCRPCGREGNRRSVVVRHRRAAAVRVRRSRVGGTVERRQALPLARYTPQRHGRDGRRGGSTARTPCPPLPAGILCRWTPSNA